MDQVQEIKNRLDLVEVIKGYLRLEKSGINFRGLCPFHNEKTPSFFVSPAKQMWHCFGCAKGGDVFAFVQGIENIEFPDALRQLAEKAGVTLKREDPKLKSQRSRLYDLLELSSKFFERQLENNEPVKKYLASRGLENLTIQEFRLGFSLESWDSLLKFLTARGFKDREVAQAGLAISNPTDSTRYYDRFRGRIMFPIFDISGRVVGFGGRVFVAQEIEQKEEAPRQSSALARGTGPVSKPSVDTGQGPKYVNTPNTLVYDKSRLLFGLNKSKNSIRELNSAVLVEGYMDFLMSWQAGVKNVVASSGTALTLEHLDILKRLTSILLTAFDMDEAGQSATKRSIDLALLKGFEVKVIKLGGNVKDPAEVVQKSPDLWKQMIAKGVPIMNFYFDKVLSQYNPEKIEHKKLIAQRFLPEIRKLSSSIEQAHWISELSLKLKIKESVLEEELKKMPTAGLSDDLMSIEQDSESKEPAKKTKIEMLLERLIYLINQVPDARSQVPTVEFDSINATPEGKLLVKMKDSQKLTDEEQGLLDYIVFKNDVFDKPQEPEKEIQFCIQSLKTIFAKDVLNKLAWQIKDAEKNQKHDEAEQLIKEFQEKSKLLHEKNEKNQS